MPEPERTPMPELDTAPLDENGGTLVTGRGEDLLDLSRDAVLAAFAASGALLFRGFSGGVESFCSFTERFSAGFRSHGGSTRTNVDGNETLQTVVAGSPNTLARTRSSDGRRSRPTSCGPTVSGLPMKAVRLYSTTARGRWLGSNPRPGCILGTAGEVQLYRATQDLDRFLEVSTVEVAAARLSAPDPKIPDASHTFSFPATS